jgi:hypothetical protein
MRDVDESFVVVSGTMPLFNGYGWIDTSAGDFLYAPPGGLHGYHNEADEPASVLMLSAPRVPREQYFEGIAAMADMTEEERREFVIRRDNYYGPIRAFRDRRLVSEGLDARADHDRIDGSRPTRAE